MTAHPGSNYCAVHVKRLFGCLQAKNRGGSLWRCGADRHEVPHYFGWDKSCFEKHKCAGLWQIHHALPPDLVTVGDGE